MARILLAPSDFNQRDVVLCDASDAAHARRIQPLAANGLTNLQFISVDRIGFTLIGGANPSAVPAGETTVVQSLSLTTGVISTVSSETAGVALAVGWSHDGTMVGYVTDTGGPTDHFWLSVKGGAPKALVPPITAGGRGGREGDETLVSFSADDHYVAFVDTDVYRLQIFRTADQTAVYTAPSGGAGGLRTQAVWMNQSDRLYFRNDTGVYIWDPLAGISTYESGLHWEDPSFSPDDHLLAFTVWDQAGDAHVQADGRRAGLGLIGGPSSRAAAGFASNDILLLSETQPCTQGMCPVSFYRTGTVVAWRVGDTTEVSVTPTGWRLVAFRPAAP